METAKVFKEILAEESYRLEMLCNKWQRFLDSTKSLSEDNKDQIRCVVGQTRLLLKEKLRQFRELIRSYESGKGDTDITKDDLEGFWDLVQIQVVDVNKKFIKLEKDIIQFTSGRKYEKHPG